MPLQQAAARIAESSNVDPEDILEIIMIIMSCFSSFNTFKDCCDGENKLMPKVGTSVIIRKNMPHIRNPRKVRDEIFVVLAELNDDQLHGIFNECKAALGEYHASDL